MKFRSIIPVIIGCAVSRIAGAQPVKGVYIDAGGGAQIPFAAKNTSLEPGIAGTFDLNQQPGYDIRSSIGYAFGNGWRFELEGVFGQSSLKGLSGTSFPSVGTGMVRNRGVMANGLFDLDVGSRYIYPYFGAGVGFQLTRLDGFMAVRTDKPSMFSASGLASGVAGQAIVGLAFPLPNWPGLSFTLDYRAMDILGGEKFNGASSIGLPPGSPSLTGAIKLHNQFENSVILSLHFAFGVQASASPAKSPTAVNSQTALFAVDPGKHP